MLIVDTHCHIDLDSFDADRVEVIQRALDGGLTKLLIPGIDIQSSYAALKLADDYPEIYLAVGVHPNSSLAWNEHSKRELLSLSRHPKVVAIGEIGLDYHWDFSPKQTQHRVFLEQLEIASEVNLPVIIHNRAATSDILGHLFSWQSGLAASNAALALRPGVLHSFSADLSSAKKIIEANFKIGITGPVTFKKAINLQEIATVIPLSSVLVETDSPYLTPDPFRGKRNEPAFVKYVVEKIADLRNLPISEVATAVGSNAARLFQW